MLDRTLIAKALADAIVSGRWDEAALVERCQRLMGGRRAWIAPLVSMLMSRYPRPPRPQAKEVAAMLLTCREFRRARLPAKLLSEYPLRPLPEMDDRSPAAAVLPAICTTRELAERLGLTISQLESLADLKQLARLRGLAERQHYHYRVLAKSGGAVRLIESPKPRLKRVQRQILREILDVVPPHEAANGFRRGRSIASFVGPHVRREVVARVDLRDFFPSITRGRVAAVFRTLGYPETVAKLLAGICTSIAPDSVWEKFRNPSSGISRMPLLYAEGKYKFPHLPQGAPTSPSIANLCAFRLDCRLAGLARAAGGHYTRYADDLAFSGDDHFARRIKRFLVHVTATVAEEGFVVQHRKTRVMRGGVRQHLAGLVVNEHANIRRDEYDRLKAVLVNCRRSGVDGQNREGHNDFRAHLNGRVAFVEQINPARGRRLRNLFAAIAW